jgi:hypothetical protein
MEIPRLSLRIDGLEWPHITYRYAFTDGFPGGRPEIVLNDRILGDILVTDRCLIEVRDGEGPWMKVPLRDLTARITKMIH